MKRPSYRDAIQWIALNDDTDFLEDEELLPSITLCFVADMFEVEIERAIQDLKRATDRDKGRRQ